MSNRKYCNCRSRVGGVCSEKKETKRADGAEEERGRAASVAEPHKLTPSHEGNALSINMAPGEGVRV